MRPARPPAERRRLPGRSVLTWTLMYGVSRAVLANAARRGDLISRLEMDPGLRADPFAAYDELRERGAVVDGAVISATTDHAAATEILRSEAFGVAGGHGELPRPLRRLLERVADPYDAGPVEPPSMLAVDPPQHTRYRRLVSRTFTARQVGRLETSIETTAHRLLDELEHRLDGGRVVDLVETYAAQLPVAVIADLLGVPERTRPDLLRWANDAASTLDPALTWRQYRAALHGVRSLHAWFGEHVRALRREPGDDLISQLAVLEGDDALTDVELHATGLLVLGAGFETTVNLIGNAVQALSAHPDQRDVVRAEPDLWGNAVEEVLRYESPVQLTLRTAYRDVEVQGHSVPRGRPVLVMLGGANRDPEVFGDPHRFDVARPEAGAHLAFSSGVHYCLGAGLARREAEVGLRSLYERFPALDAAGAPVRRGTRVLRGYERLPVAAQTSVDR